MPPAAAAAAATSTQRADAELVAPRGWALLLGAGAGDRASDAGALGGGGGMLVRTGAFWLTASAIPPWPLVDRFCAFCYDTVDPRLWLWHAQTELRALGDVFERRAQPFDGSTTPCRSAALWD